MKITIHRGSDQIGGCVTEYEYNGYRLFVDYGEQLPGAKNVQPLEIEGLTKGDLSKSALLITHYHGDHIGCINKIPSEVPICIGKVGREIQLVLSEHLSSVDDLHKDIIARLQDAKTFTAGESFEIGPFKIMPVTIDHSAFDAYAFKIESDGVSVFHTGDFRTHGFRSGKLPKTIEQYVGRVDYVVCEGTNVSRPDATSKSERQLQKEFEELFRQNKGSVIYVSSTNIDRIFALYHAALRTGRKFIVDRYQKQIMDVVVEQKHIWNKSKLYRYGEEEPMELKYEYGSGEFLLTDKFKYLLDEVGYVLITRANPRFDNLVSRIPGDKKKYLSMWEGYVKKGQEAYNEKLAASLSDGYTPMHTSGHCDMKSMREFFRLLQPKGIIPIHTDKPEAFAKLFCDEWPIIRLYDGESISPVASSKADSSRAYIYCTKEFEAGTVYENREDWEEAHGLDTKTIGSFKTIEESKFVLEHTLYKPEALVGYEIQDEEDISPSETQTFGGTMQLLATYTHGGHQPDGAKFQEACRFTQGEKALAVFQAPYDAIVPVVVKGPITLESERESWEMNDPKDYYDTYEDYVKDWDDWHWDSVVVHPLVKLKSGHYQMADIETIPRVRLFPYGNTDEWGVTYSDNGKALRHIDSERFHCEEYTIPDGVETIGFAFIFAEDKHLRKIHLPSTLRHMVDNTFIDCPIEELVLPEGMTEIPGCMCENCRELKRVVLPSTLKVIGNAAFCHCEKLTDIVLPEGLEVIRDDAFGCCVSLKHLELPSSLKFIGPDTFLESGVEHLSKFENNYEGTPSV